MPSPVSALAIVAGLLAAGPVVAQVASIDSRNSPAALRCSALGQIDEAERPAAIYFMAGYSSGERDATAFASPTETLGADVSPDGTEQAADGAAEGAGAAEQPAEPTDDAATEQPAEDAAAAISALTGGPPAAVLPTVPVEAVLAACAQSPDSRIIDIIVAQGALGTD